MNRSKSLLRILAVTLVVTGSCAWGWQQSGISGYVGQDLTKLSPSKAKAFATLAKRYTRETSKEPWFQPEPYWIKPYASGSISWLYLMIYPGYDIPDVSYFCAYGFDRKWNRVTRDVVGTGYRLRLHDQELIKEPWIGVPVLNITVTSVGPFRKVNGQPSVPAFHPSTGIEQSYVFAEDGVRLIRMRDGAGKMLRNSYRWDEPSIGPTTSRKAAKQWRADLFSTYPTLQLAALVWLAGEHLNARDWRREGHSREPVVASKAFESLRADKAVRSQIESLAKSANPWLKKQAMFTLTQLSGPLSEVEKPPW